MDGHRGESMQISAPGGTLRWVSAHWVLRKLTAAPCGGGMWWLNTAATTLNHPPCPAPMHRCARSKHDSAIRKALRIGPLIAQKSAKCFWNTDHLQLPIAHVGVRHTCESTQAKGPQHLHWWARESPTRTAGTSCPCGRTGLHLFSFSPLQKTKLLNESKKYYFWSCPAPIKGFGCSVRFSQV